MANLQKERLLKQIFNLLILVGIGSTMAYMSKLFEWEISRPLQMGFVLTTFYISANGAVQYTQKHRPTIQSSGSLVFGFH